MPAGEIHYSDVGTEFQFTIYDEDSNIVDVSGATVRQVTFQRPDATTFTKNLSFLTDGTDGIVTYTILSGDLNMVGNWQFQAFVTISAGSFYSDVTRFEVFENLYNP